MIPALLATACLALGGCGGRTHVVQANHETCGKQMTDLQDALASGAMTEHEYNKAHRAAMERCTRRDDRD
ncbi:hypothetical protein CA260_14960 [Dyella jiangningensis]|uniref:SHOCT domain-containing protein n=1 Tax=Dyella jiangningensis TaxID=1379159 RepID=A0A328P3U5_9GAMM|nr:hypothetical protein CA260_14960 [Dyella jiangningensis]